MTTLADVNATLGAQNLALSEVVKAQKETNTGISSFLEHIKTTDARDRREDQEDRREAKKASVLGTTLGAAGGYARSAGGALATAGKKSFNIAKSGLSGLKGLGGGFLGGLLSSKLIRFGLPALAFMMGDEIADYIIGPDGSGALKKQLSFAIKGGAIGSLLGPRFGLLGLAIGGLLGDDKINEELGIMTEKINELVKKIGIKDGLAGLFQKITKGIGIGLESINKLLDGQVNVDNIIKGGAVIGGLATLLLPGKMLGLAFKAGRLLLMTPIGRAILFAFGGYKLLQSVINSGGETANNARFMTGPEGDFDYGKQAKNIEAGKADEKMKIPGLDNPLSEMSTMDQIIAGMMAGQIAFSGGKLIVKAGSKMFPRGAPGSVKSPSLASELKNLKNVPKSGPKPASGSSILKNMFNMVKTGGKYGLALLRNVPLLLPAATVAEVTRFLLPTKEMTDETNKRAAIKKMTGNVDAKSTDLGIVEDFGMGGGSDSLMANRLRRMNKKDPLSEYFTSSRIERDILDQQKRMQKGQTNVVNSGNTSINNNQTSGIMLNGSLNGHDLGDQVSLKQQLKLVSPSFQGF